MAPRRGELLAALVLSVVSMAAFLALPMLIAAVSAHFALSDAAVGWLGSGVAAGTALSSLVMPMVVRRVNWVRLGRLACLLLLGGMTVSLLATSWPVFLVAQCLAAIGGGAAYSLALTVLSDARQSGRWFGYSVAAQVAFQVLAMLAGPGLIAAGGLHAVLVALMAMYAVGALSSAWLPVGGGHPAHPDASAATQPARSLPATLMALAGCSLFFFNVGVVWTYLSPLAQQAGFTADAIGNGLAVGVAFGVPGALLAAWCGERFGHVAMIGGGALATVLALWLLRGTPGFGAFVVAVALYNLAWNFSLSFQYAAVNAVDASGKGVAAAPAFHGAGGALGPAAGALLVGGHGLSVVLLLGAVAVAVSWLLFAGGALLRTDAVATPDAERVA